MHVVIGTRGTQQNKERKRGKKKGVSPGRTTREGEEKEKREMLHTREFELQYIHKRNCRAITRIAHGDEITGSETESTVEDRSSAGRREGGRLVWRGEMKGERKCERKMGSETRTRSCRGGPEPGPGRTEDKDENGKRKVRKADYELK